MLGDGLNLPFGALEHVLEEEREDVTVGQDTDVAAAGLDLELAVSDVLDLPLRTE